MNKYNARLPGRQGDVHDAHGGAELNEGAPARRHPGVTA